MYILLSEDITVRNDDYSVYGEHIPVHLWMKDKGPPSVLPLRKVPAYFLR